MPSHTAPELSAAKEADWQELKSGNSILSTPDHPEGILEAFGSIMGHGDKPIDKRNKRGLDALLIFLVMFFEGETATNIVLLQLSSGHITDYLSIGGDMRDYFSNVVTELSEAGEAKKKEIHEKYFCVAKFTILSVKALLLLPQPVTREACIALGGLASEWRLYMDHVNTLVTIPKSNKYRFKSPFDDPFQLITLVAMLKAAIVLQQAGGPASERLAIKKAQTKDYVGTLEKKHDLYAWSQLVLLGLQEGSPANRCTGLKSCEKDGCKRSKEQLKKKCKQLEAALRSINTMEDLPREEDKFQDVLKAVLWGKYFCHSIEMKKNMDESVEEDHDDECEILREMMLTSHIIKEGTLNFVLPIENMFFADSGPFESRSKSDGCATQ